MGPGSPGVVIPVGEHSQFRVSNRKVLLGTEGPGACALSPIEPHGRASPQGGAVLLPGDQEGMLSRKN